MKKHQGYSLIELTIAILIIGFALIAVSINVGSALVGVKIENVVGDIAANIFFAERDAKSGSLDPQKRRFDLLKADIKSHSGIIVTTEPISDGQKSCGTCSSLEAVLCVSNQPFCYSPTPSFTFERYSGKLSESHVIFFISKNRKLALLIERNGKYSIAELINGQWRSRTDLQGLLPAKQTKG
jgi:prepilin-type N-terminal cleavage/methylation domain-containing protein